MQRVTELLTETRLALRRLRRSPLSTAVVLAVLAVGIGTNVAIFAVVASVWGHVLPYDDPARIVMLWEDQSERGGTSRSPVAGANFVDWREASGDLFVELAASRNESRRLTGLEQPVVPLTHAVTDNYFELLGARPHLGRLLEPGENESEGSPVVVSYGLWQSALGGRADVVGSVLQLDGQPHTVVGVMSPDFYSRHQFEVQPDLWSPATDVIQGTELRRDRRDLTVFGRLAPGATLGAAKARMKDIGSRLARTYPDTNEGWNIAVVGLRDDIVGPMRSTFVLLLLAAGAVLLLAAVNITNLMLARAAQRQRELSLESALGASRARLVRSSVVESLVLAFLGGGLGLVLGAALTPLLRGAIPLSAGVPFLDSISLDGRVVVAAAVATLLTVTVFGLVPALRAASTQPVSLLAGGSTRTGQDRASTRRGGLLIVAEVAMAVVLISAAGLLLQSFLALRAFEPGINTVNTLTIRNSLRGPTMLDVDRRIDHFRTVVDDLEALPEIESAAAASFAPPLVGGFFNRFTATGVAEEIGEEPQALTVSVTAGYFETLEVELLAGRFFDTRDRADTTPVAIVSEALARRYFDGHEAIGQSITLASDVRPVLGPGIERRIVGVVGDVMGGGLDPLPHPTIYFVHPQTPFPIMTFVMKAAIDTDTAGQRAEALIWSRSAEGNVYARKSMAQRIADTRWQADLATLLLGCFAVLSLLLGTAGIFAVVSYSVATRVREMGIRKAFGASAGGLRQLVLGRIATWALLGIALGILFALASGHLLEGLLFGVHSRDPRTFALVGVLMLLAAVVAAWLPAERAARIEPATALRRDD